MGNGRENRRSERVMIKIPIRFSIPGEEIKGDFIELDTSNLSFEGVFIRTNSTLYLGTRVTVQFFIEDGNENQPLLLSGKVIRIDEDGMALSLAESENIDQLSELGNTDHSKLSCLIEQYAAPSYSEST